MISVKACCIVCPNLPQETQITSTPSQSIPCFRWPMKNMFLMGISSGTLIKMCAYLYLKVDEVHISVLSSLPNFFPIITRIL